MPETQLADRVFLDEALLRAAQRRTELPAPRVCRAIRLAAGLTQDDLARILHVTRPTVARYEGGTREPKGERRSRYADLLQELRRHV